MDGLTPKVSDFGIVRLLPDSTMETRFLSRTGEPRGTPSYMAPEQVDGRRELGPEVDIHGIGAVLYHMLTGRPPFTGATNWDIYQATLFEDAIPPRRLNSQVERYLNTICCACLDKNPERRYSTGGLLAEDLERFLVGDPPLIRPLPWYIQVGRWVTRNGWSLLILGLFLVGVFAVVAGIFWRIAENAKDTVEQQKTQIETAHGQLTVAKHETDSLNTTLVTDRGVIAIGRSNPTTAVFHLLSALELAPTDHADQQRYLRTALASAYDSMHRLEHIFEHPSEIRATAASPDGRSIASVGASGLLQVHDLATGNSRQTLIRPEVLPVKETALSLAAVSFTPNGQFIVTAADGGQVYKVDTKTLSRSLIGRFSGNPRSLSVTSDGKKIVVGGIGTSRSEQSLATYNLAGDVAKPKFPFKVDGQVDAVAFSPDGRYFATSGRGKNSLTIWDVEKNIEFPPIPHAGRIFAITFSPDGSKVVTGCIDCNVRFWNTKTQIADGLPLRHSHPVRTLAYHTSEDGEFLLSAAEDGTSQVWDIGLRTPVGQPLYHVGNIRGVAFCSDNGITRLITTGFDRVIRVWRLRPARP